MLRLLPQPRTLHLPCQSTPSVCTMVTKHSRLAPILRIKKLSPQAILPSRGSSLAAGLDLAAAYDAVIPAGSKGLVKTDLAIAVPDSCYARVAPRSGLALKNFIDTGAGVIDADYRGNVGVLLFNHSTEDFAVKRGDRVAQLILERIEYPRIEEVDEIDQTARGASGFGSTGVSLPIAKKQRVALNDVPLSEGGETAVDTTFKALELMLVNKVMDDDMRRLLKKKLCMASERQFMLLSKALNNYLEDEDSGKVLEWITAFLEAK